jgi:hypothetical protein
MNKAKPDFNELFALCGKVRDNELTTTDYARLESLLLGDSNALQFYQRFMKVCSGLEQICDTATSAGDLETTIDEATKESTTRLLSTTDSVAISEYPVVRLASQADSDGSRTRVRFSAIAVVASALLAVGAWMSWRATPVDPVSLVAVVGEVQTVWGNGFTMPASQRLANGRYVLQSGATQLRFDNGVELLVQAPSMFSLDSPMQATLETGSLTLYVPESGKGFRVDTPQAMVVDRGTRIGIMTEDERGLEVHVFEGRAEAMVKDSLVRETLTAGQAATIVREESSPPTVKRIPAKESYFANSLDDLDDLPMVQGDIDLLVSPPRSVRRVASELVDAGRASLFVEVQGVTLESELRVTCTQPGRCAELEAFNDHLPAGTRIDGFLVHLAVPRKMRTGDQHLTADGTIVFPRAVLAVVTHEPGKMDSDLRSAYTDYPADRRTGLEDAIDGNSEFADRIILSEDRRTLTFHLDVHGRLAATQEDFVDQFRVLLQSETAP